MVNFRIEQVPKELENLVQDELMEIINEYGLILIVSYEDGDEIAWQVGDKAIGIEETDKEGGTE